MTRIPQDHAKRSHKTALKIGAKEYSTPKNTQNNNNDRMTGKESAVGRLVGERAAKKGLGGPIIPNTKGGFC
jgi:hypothetical protein